MARSTNARSLVEAVLREMERRFGDANPPTDGDLVRQYSRVIKLLNLDRTRKASTRPSYPSSEGWSVWSTALRACAIPPVTPMPAITDQNRTMRAWQ